jgi:threonine dehydrogenase-like Zn-dependent dehydrogenase
VVVIGGSEERLKMAERVGALTLNRRTTTEAERRAFVAGLTAGRGADLVVEASGTTAAITEGLGLVRRGGAYLSLGIAVPEGPGIGHAIVWARVERATVARETFTRA